MRKTMSIANKANVLIVDDDELSRETLADLLSQEDCILHQAENGAQALAYAREIRPDLILLDVMMPEMSGYQVCAALRQDPQLAEVPVILVTALDDQDSRVKGLEAGADDFVSKPYERTELRARVRTVLKLNRFRRLLAERGKFAWVVEKSEEGYLLLDSQQRITYANPRACCYLYADSAPLGEDFSTRIQRYYQCLPEHAWENWPPSGYDPCYLVRAETPDTPALWLHVETFPYPGDGDIPVRLHDVTERFNTVRQVWTFHGLISHKLRTPLTGLKSLQLVRIQLSKQVNIDPIVLQLLEMAEQSANRLEHHLMDVLNYIHAPYLLEPAPHSLALPQIENLAEEIAAELKIQLCVEIDDGVRGQAVYLNRYTLKSVFQTLFDNAKKFHPRYQPQVLLKISAADKANQIKLSVCDDGRHLPPETLPQLWQPYFQGEKNFTGEVRGTGLGLSGVAMVIWSVGGHCLARNRPDRPGLIIEISLPAA
jgi:two-component system, cell cycle response regulator